MATLTQSVKTIRDYNPGYYTYRCIVTENSTDVSNNTSNVTITFSIAGPANWGTAFYEWTTYCGILVDGSVVKTGSSAPKVTQSYTNLLTWTGNITHNSDGSKSISVGVYLHQSGPANYLPTQHYSSSPVSMGSVGLTKIPRQANIASAPDFNDEQNPTITYSNSAGNSVTSLHACISLTGAKDDIAYRDIPKTGSSYTFNLTDTERDVLRNSCTTSNSRTVIFFVRTVIGGQTFHSTLSKTLTIVNANPVISDSSLSYYDSSSTANKTGNNQIIVKGKSNLVIKYTQATAKKGASISRYKFTLNSGSTLIDKESVSANGTINFGVINTSSVKISAYAIDSRGNTSNTTSIEIQCYDHQNPYFVSFQAYRANEKGETNESGTYIYCTYTACYSSVKNTNSAKIKISNGSSVIEPAGEVTANETLGTITGSVLIDLKGDKTKTYQVSATIIDNYNASANSNSITIFGESRIMNILADGTGIAFGKMAEEPNLLDVKWNIKTNGSYVETKPTELYYNASGSAGTITLSQDSSMFLYLEIFYRDDTSDQKQSIRVWSPDGDYVTLSCIEPNSSNSEAIVQIRANGWTISGDSIIPGHLGFNYPTGVYLEIKKDTNNAIKISNMTSGNGYIKITQVFGYR